MYVLCCSDRSRSWGPGALHEALTLDADAQARRGAVAGAAPRHALLRDEALAIGLRCGVGDVAGNLVADLVAAACLAGEVFQQGLAVVGELELLVGWLVGWLVRWLGDLNKRTNERMNS